MIFTRENNNKIFEKQETEVERNIKQGRCMDMGGEDGHGMSGHK